MKRSGPPARKTELGRGKPLERGTSQLKRTGRLVAKPKPVEQRDAEEAVRQLVFARDGGCLMRRLEPDRCRGRLTFHHLEKAWTGAPYTADNGVCLCLGHNGDVEDDPPRYRQLGLVVRPGIDHQEAARRRRAAGIQPRRTP